MATPKRTPTPVSTKKATAPSPTSPHMYERKQSCIKLGDLLPSGQLTPVSHFMQFSGHLCFLKKREKAHLWRTLANKIPPETATTK